MQLPVSTTYQTHLTTVAAGASAVSWLPTLDLTLRIGASLVAIICGLPVAISVVKKWLGK